MSNNSKPTKEFLRAERVETAAQCMVCLLAVLVVWAGVQRSPEDEASSEPSPVDQLDPASYELPSAYDSQCLVCSQPEACPALEIRRPEYLVRLLEAQGP